MPKRNYLDYSEANSRMEVVNSGTTFAFDCFRCNLPKKAKIRVFWHTKAEGTKVLCNSCYEAVIKKKRKIVKKGKPFPGEEESESTTSATATAESTTSSNEAADAKAEQAEDSNESKNDFVCKSSDLM